MIIFPAIDLRHGKCVRLLHGRADKETVYGDDPVAVAREWQEQGGEFLHMVDLDGAFEGTPAHLDVIGEVVKALDIPVEVGGGIRTTAIAEAYLNAGVERVIIGTRALEDPDWLAGLCKEWPGRICAGVDAKEGMVAVKGWVEKSTTPAVAFAERLTGMGLRAVIYTDISRDGAETGPNLEATQAFADAIDAPVVASGGVGTLDHVKAVAELSVEGLIVGRALYTGAVSLADAIAAGK